MSNPSNFYTYRNTFVDNDVIRDRKIDIKEGLENASGDLKKRLVLAELLLDCLYHWNQGNSEFIKGRFIAAEGHYNRFHETVISYFVTAYTNVPANLKNNTDIHNKLILLRLFFSSQQGIFGPPLPDPQVFLSHIAGRNVPTTLDGLFRHDWIEPALFSRDTFGSLYSNNLLLGASFIELSTRQEKFDAPLLILACVFIPLALAEVKRYRRQFNAAIAQLDRVLAYHSVVNTDGERLLNEFIELPYLRLARGQILLERADSEYKTRITASAGQELQAAETYREVLTLFSSEGQYVARVQAGAASLKSETDELLEKPFHPLLARGTNGNSSETLVTESKEFLTLATSIPIETIEPTSATLPGLDRRTGPHESLIKFVPLPAEPVLNETNPLIYALVIEAQARLMQIEAGFNYLGYRDDYVPPWRFQFLLERARYFAEHAKNAQREYLNFLSNAEREEFQEVTLAQSVELERSNVRIETARVQQARLEVEISKLSEELAELVEEQSEDRLEVFVGFDEAVDKLTGIGDDAGGFRSVLGNTFGGVVNGALDFFSGGAISKRINIAIAGRQRDVEKFNLTLAIGEAKKSAEIAQAQLDAAQAGLIVAGMQRTAALLRHEFAVENLAFLRDRELSAEMWFRLADIIRSVSVTYMRYAMELAFLAEQAYEFEADKRINVVRFDYDVSEEASLLAADFLMRDLDTLEQDLIVNQKQRQQQVRYVLSLAREFPEALQELRDNGSMIFSLRLEQLERRFPGLFNLRIGSVEVTPVALMDPTRFSLELTHLGTSQLRIKAQPDTPSGVPSSSPLNTNDLLQEDGEDSWLASFGDAWPVKIPVTGPETTIFSGLTEPEAATVFPFVSTSQRDAFEGLGAAASWRIDLSMKENQIVPGALADILMTFTLSGYYDAGLRSAADNARRGRTVLTQHLSARQFFADGFYDLNHTGRMTWNVTEDMLSLHAPVGGLRNLGMVLLSVPRRAQFSHLMSQFLIEIDVAADGQFEVLSPIPDVTFSTDLLDVTVVVENVGGADISWDFGDETGFQTGGEHSYERPGEYQVTLRLVKDGRLKEFRSEVSVSRTQTLTPPLTAFPSFSSPPTGQTGISSEVNVAPDEEIIAVWRVDQNPSQKGAEILLEIPPGKHTVSFTALRKIRARIHSQQRFVPDQQLEFNGLSVSTNRVFDLDGTESTGSGGNDSPNALTEHLFPRDPVSDQPTPLSPVDDWTLELTVDDNPFLRSVTSSDVVELELDDIADAVLILEFEADIA